MWVCWQRRDRASERQPHPARCGVGISQRYHSFPGKNARIVAL
ncbi:hypothetical protein PXO_04154 [Xanthomonas oryzae pv. oryzae PXO99A]|uniref:Uncharacterized protein n=1 Tax=Xanthomonas oryzae pv. oryzae (strain PXO99A) TaxID=360094 RepID=A0A0K0GH67_XANOP|nr:hypothetical protein PXO_04154 [Xanthomonas oryzae pv. oryzae PXO99A]